MSLIEEALRRHEPPPPPREPASTPPRPPQPGQRRPAGALSPWNVAAMLTGVFFLLLTLILVTLRERKTPPGRSVSWPPRETPPLSGHVPAIPSFRPAEPPTNRESIRPPDPVVSDPLQTTSVTPPVVTAPTATVARSSAPEPMLPDVPPSASPATQPAVWPLFSVKGVAVGDNNLVMLDTGEMLEAGERSRTGARVVQIHPHGVVFEWKGQTNLLRKGESSDKPSF